jgi:hypothetical protein
VQPVGCGVLVAGPGEFERVQRRDDDLMSRRLTRESTLSGAIPDRADPPPLLPQHRAPLRQEINALPKIGPRPFGAFPHHHDGLHGATSGDMSVHLRPCLGRQPAPQQIFHAYIEPVGRS